LTKDITISQLYSNARSKVYLDMTNFGITLPTNHVTPLYYKYKKASIDTSQCLQK